jgi:hypothetical protein
LETGIAAKFDALFDNSKALLAALLLQGVDKRQIAAPAVTDGCHAQH